MAAWQQPMPEQEPFSSRPAPGHVAMHPVMYVEPVANWEASEELT